MEKGDVGELTVHTTALEIHARREHALGTDRPLNLHPVLAGRVLHDVRLEDEAGVPLLRRGREAGGDFLLRTEQLHDGAFLGIGFPDEKG